MDNQTYQVFMGHINACIMKTYLKKKKKGEEKVSNTAYNLHNNLISGLAKDYKWKL